MSTIKDTLDARLADRLRAERQARRWTVAELATKSGVSRAMISKVERAEASPTAALLGRLSGAFSLTLSTLLARAENGGAGQVSRAAEQTVWRDPASGYLRRAVAPPGADPELVEVELPAGARVAFPEATYRPIRGQCIWLLEGTLLFQEGSVEHRLGQGDCLALGPPADCAFHNPGPGWCRYLVALSRR